MDDPALAYDSLPQPYRMVWKLIDDYILDPTWLEITRIHPELLQDENGEAFKTPHNQQLQNICTPTSVTEQDFATTSLLEREGFLFGCTNSDAFIIIDPNDGKVAASCALEKDPVIIADDNEDAAAAADAEVVKPRPTKVTNMWISSASASMSKQRVIHFSVVSVVEAEEEAAEEADPKAKKKGKAPAEAEVKPKVPKCRLVVVRVTLGLVEGFKSSLIQIDKLGEALVPMAKPDIDELGNIDISMDGTLVSVSTSVGCSLFEIPFKEIEMSGNVAGIAEAPDVLKEEVTKEKEGEEDDLPGEVCLDPLCVINTEEHCAGHRIKRVSLFPLYKPAKKEKTPAVTGIVDMNIKETGEEDTKTVKKAIPDTLHYHTGLAVIFENTPEWWIMGIRGLDNKTGSKIEDQPVTVEKLYSWELNASISAVMLDEDRAIMVIGMVDGSVSLWNLTTRALTSVVGRHETAVSSVCFLRCTGDKGQDDQFYIVTGAIDGSICFFDVLLPSPPQKSSRIFIQSNNQTNPTCISTKFLSFRLDVNPEISIVGIRSIKGLPWALVQCSDGMCMVYDVQNVLLLGRLALYSGMTSRQIKWKLANFEEITTVPTFPPPPPSGEAIEDDLGYPVEGSEGEGKVVEEGQEEQKELEDPNKFTRMPAAKRAMKFSVTDSFSWKEPILLDSVASPSTNGYHCMYYRNNMPVMATFHVDDLIMNLHADLVESLKLDRTDMLSLYRRLNAEDRLNPEMARQKISRYDNDYDGMGGLSQDGTDSLERYSSQSGTQGQGSLSGSRRNTSDTKVGKPSTGGGMGSAGIRSGSITKSNLDALQMSLGNGKTAGSVSESNILKKSYDRIAEPNSMATSSAKNSMADRQSRKNRLQNRLTSISNVF